VNYEDAKFDRSKVKHLHASDVSENPVSSP